MPIIELQIVKSTQDPDKLSLRPMNRAASDLRRELTKAGFEVGEKVFLVSEAEMQQLREAEKND
jgi:hypothetical protein